MYITIIAQKLSSAFNQSVADFVNYLEKENNEKLAELQEHFFNQYEDYISQEQVYVLPKFLLEANEKIQIELQELKGSRSVVLKRELTNNHFISVVQHFVMKIFEINFCCF